MPSNFSLSLSLILIALLGIFTKKPFRVGEIARLRMR